MNHTRVSASTRGSKGRRAGRTAAILGLSVTSIVALAIPAHAATFTDNSPCTTVLTTTATKASVSDVSCQYAQPGITRYYAGGPVTYWGALAPTGTSRSVIATNGTCINHEAAWFLIAGSGIHTHSGGC